jgi:hypothetical protein
LCLCLFLITFLGLAFKWVGAYRTDGQSVTPHLDRLARNGARFSNAYRFVCATVDESRPKSDGSWWRLGVVLLGVAVGMAVVVLVLWLRKLAQALGDKTAIKIFGSGLSFHSLSNHH